MSIPEFFRPEDLRPVDADGYELPEWENPYFAIPDQAGPTDADAEWLATHPISGGAPDGPTEADIDDARRIAEWQDRLEMSHRLDDADLAAAGLGVG